MDTKQTDSASCQLVSSGSGSNDISTAPRARSDGLTPNTLEIRLVAKDGKIWEYIKFSAEWSGRLQAQSVLIENKGLTQYANHMLNSLLECV